MNENKITEINQYLTFRLEKDIYSINVGYVKEVVEYSPVTKIPKSPKFMLGIFNLREKGISLVDMRDKFGMPKVEKTIDTRFIVVEMVYENDLITIGLMVDSVLEVIELADDMIDPPPKIGTRLKPEYIKGVGKIDAKESFIIILNLEKIFSVEDLSILQDNVKIMADSN